MPTSSPTFSPSACHWHLMNQITPALAYRAGSVRSWQSRFRPKLVELTGFDHFPTRRPALKPRRLWRRQTPLGVIEKIRFTSEPRSDVLAYVCLPRDVRPPYRFMICLQGHSTGMHNSIAISEDEKHPIAVEGDRDFAIGCLRRGWAALCIEQRSLGQRGEKVQGHVSPHPCFDAVMHSLMLGRTLVGERVFDVDRGIDYLESRGDADLDYLGVMGNSGGALTTMYAAALLPRVRLAIPSCQFCSFKHSFMRIYHCGDNYVPGILQWAEAGDVLGLFAPRPLVVVAGKEDWNVPIAGVRQEFARVKRIYTAAGAADRCRLVVGPEGHRFYADLAWKAMDHLLSKPARDR